MPIKAFIFDCGGVVLRARENNVYQQWEERFGYTVGQLSERLWTSDAYRRAEIGQLTEDAFWEEIACALPLTYPEQIIELRQDLWGVFELNEKVLAWVDRLRSSYRVVILSNATEVLDDILRDKFQIANRFDMIFNSARLGMAKPDPAIYYEVLSRLGITAGEAVFIDDRAENIASAAMVGLHVLWFVSDQELDRQLHKYLDQDTPLSSS
ncbi:MAG: HAD family hydrolase [Anaerolineae bacterium]